MSLEQQVQLIEMSDTERDAFIAESFIEYLNHMISSGRWTSHNAQDRLNALMVTAPSDRRAAGQRFYRIVGAGEVRGGLWLQIDMDVMFVMQITILPTMRRQGWARAAMREAEHLAREQGMRRLALNVFFENECAQRLYEQEGYAGILQQMVKRLD